MFKNKVAIITGSTRGIGYAIAEKLGNEGASVVISSRHQKDIDAAVKKLNDKNIKAFGIVCDVSKEEDNKALVNFAIEKCDKLDIIVCNAGVFTNPKNKYSWEESEEDWNYTMNVNVNGPRYLIKYSMPHLKCKKESSGSQKNIIFISSVAAYFLAPIFGTYCLSKLTLNGMAKCLSKECAPLGVRVNTIAPGLIKTVMAKHILENKEMFDGFMAQTPLGRPGESKEIAESVSFLCSDNASYITGQTLQVSGGFLTQL
tara:strand:+ start:4709 stop:5482 length:774 start_codon:yes stop_codon:yes gene_type:complete